MGCRVTGAVTRELVGRAARIIAVEPDERMRTVLAARCPEAEVLAGRGEDIPLPAASVDAVVISSAWHWLDPERAVPEIARVLRVGGTPMSGPEELIVEYSLPVTSDELVGLLGTYSGVITMGRDQRAEFSRRVRAFLDRQPWDQVDLPMICRCLKSTRLPG